MEDLWKIRQRKQMTVAQLSGRAGIPARLIQEYEAGRKPISMENLEKLARVLFVEVMAIKPLSAPIPLEVAAAPARPPREQAAPAARPAPSDRATQVPIAPPSPARPPRAAAQEAHARLPARESQITHLRMLAERFGWDESQLEKEIGKPLAQLMRPDASLALKQLQERIAAERPHKAKKRRPYLPESVDNFELEYLQKQQQSGATLAFALFNGNQITGQIIGFGPYNITVKTEQGEVSLNKLAVAYYRQIGQEKDK